MSLFLTFLALTDAPTSTPAISVSTALLLIAVGLLVFVAKAIADLRTEVEDLRERLTARPPSPLEHASPVTTMADQPYRIVAVAQSTHDAGWSLEGRRQVFQSHQVR